MPRPLPRPTLLQAFALAGLVLALLGAAGAVLLLRGARRTTLEAAERLRASAALRAQQLVQQELGTASGALEDLEREVHLGTSSLAGPEEAAPALLRALGRAPHLSEVTFTHAVREGFDEEGGALLAPGGRWQVAAWRESTAPGAPLVVRRTLPGPTGFVAVDERVRPGERAGAEGGHPVPDPAAHLTFLTPASRAFDGAALWNDLSWSELEGAPSADGRRVVVSVQRALRGAEGEFAGVLRAGLLSEAIDEVARLRVDEQDPADPHRVFLADLDGRLVSRLGPGDRLVRDGDDLRVRSAALPEEIGRALAAPALAGLDEEEPEAAGAFEAGGARWLYTFRLLPGTQGWAVGIVVPEAAYTRPLDRLRDVFLAGAAGAALLLLLGGGALLAALRRGLRRIGDAAAQMRGLDFTARPASAPFRDLQEVAEGLERAKTAARALGRYVPVDLVRTLFRENREPAPGGELRELTLFFSDLAGFTGLAERLDPGTLARALGSYFTAVTGAIAAAGGTVDKFIGDSVMALWNAPERRDGHAFLACAAALQCQAAARRLFASPAWEGLPPLTTRIGLHTGPVLVGHFGSPERLSYTALGDGVNLASRLEGLCKQYGVSILVSEEVATRVGGAFELRLVDRVAVKGRSQGVRVFELVARKGAADALLPRLRAYEEAFAAYECGQFAAAAERLERLAGDGPAEVLLGRCRALLAAPPADGWSALHVAASK